MSLTTLQIHNISSFFHFVYTFLKKYDKIVTVHDKPYYILDKIYQFTQKCSFKLIFEELLQKFFGTLSLSPH